MLNSKLSLCSRRDPLWVAAYCFKQLKKAQVLYTDIPSSVDKILQYEMDATSYRVLAYLLLGAVRIYSKKVEYLFDDSNEVLLKINKFVMTTKKNAHQETLRMSVTIPDRFELDAFNLDILEDHGGDHIAPQEKITLKEVLSKTERFEQFSQDKFEDFDSGGSSSTYSANHFMVEDFHQLMSSMEFEVFPSNSSINLVEGEELFQRSILSRKEPMNFDTVFVVDEIENESINLSGKDQQINEDQAVQEVVEDEDEIHKERSKISEEESTDISNFSEREKEPVLSVEAFNESREVGDDHIMARETSSSSCQMRQENIEIHEARNFQESTGRPQDDISSQKECVDHVTSSVAKESLGEHIEGSVEERDKEGNSVFQENVSVEDGTHSFISAESKNLDVTPQSKFQGHSAGRRKPGTTTSGSMLISTPAVRERALSSRKRKSVFDEITVLPNEVLRRSLIDTSDLVANRRKFRHTLLSKRRESRISGLPNGFYESVLPCLSPQLQSLFSNKKMKISDSLEIVQSPGRLDVSKSQTVGRPEHIETASPIPSRCPDPLVIDETPVKLNVSECQTFDSPEHIATPPQTPPLCQTVRVRSVHSVELPRSTEIQYSDNLGPSSPHANTEREQPSSSHANTGSEQPSSPHANTEREQLLEENEVPELMEKFNIEASDSYESLEREQCSTKDEELNLINEEINSCETENSELVPGWSARTRKVASFLHRRFLQTEGDVLNFSQVVGRRNRKESARMFYELLVLRTTSHVDLKQDKAYGDIAVSKLQKFDQTFGVDGS